MVRCWCLECWSSTDCWFQPRWPVDIRKASDEWRNFRSRVRIHRNRWSDISVLDWPPMSGAVFSRFPIRECRTICRREREKEKMIRIINQTTSLTNLMKHSMEMVKAIWTRWPSVSDGDFFCYPEGTFDEDWGDWGYCGYCGYCATGGIEADQTRSTYESVDLSWAESPSMREAACPLVARGV